MDCNLTMAVPKKILRLSQNFEELKRQVQLLEATVKKISIKNELLEKENAIQHKTILQLVNLQKSKSKPVVQQQVCDWNHPFCNITHAKFNHVGLKPQVVTKPIMNTVPTKPQVVEKPNMKTVQIEPKPIVLEKNVKLDHAATTSQHAESCRPKEKPIYFPNISIDANASYREKARFLLSNGFRQTSKGDWIANGLDTENESDDDETDEEASTENHVCADDVASATMEDSGFGLEKLVAEGLITQDHIEYLTSSNVGDFSGMICDSSKSSLEE